MSRCKNEGEKRRIVGRRVGKEEVEGEEGEKEPEEEGRKEVAIG